MGEFALECKGRRPEVSNGVPPTFILPWQGHKSCMILGGPGGRGGREAPSEPRSFDLAPRRDSIPPPRPRPYRTAPEVQHAPLLDISPRSPDSDRHLPL